MPNQDWGSRAACREYPSDWWFGASSKQAEAIEICDGCPVRHQCGEAADDAGETWAIAGGFKLSDETQRNGLRQWLGRPVRRSRTRGEPEVSVVPVRQHMKMLMYRGMSYSQIARMADMPRPTVVGLMSLRGDRKRQSLSQSYARRILVIPLPERVR